MYTAFFNSIRFTEYRIGIKFDKDPSSVEQNNYSTKIANVYIVYDLDAWLRNPTKNFKFKNCLFGATNIVKNSDKEKCVYSGYGITFDNAGSWNFGNDFARNVIIFGVDNSSSSHFDNRKNKFLILGEGRTCGINGSFGPLKKSLVLILLKETQNFVWVYIIMLMLVICLLMEKRSLNLCWQWKCYFSYTISEIKPCS